MNEAAGTPSVRATIEAAGAVLWRAVDSRLPQVALVHRPKYDDWSLPKGKRDKGEHLLETAVREVAEETGYRVALGRPLGVQRYEVSGAPKEVHYWAAEARVGTFHPHQEIDDLEWLEVEPAKARVSRASDVDILDAFAAGPARTTALLLIRHAQAIPRDQWTGDDERRPLDPLGEEQARLAVPRIAAFAPQRVITSPALRCSATVTPYAEAYGLGVELVPAISERGHEKDPTATAAELLDVLHGGVSAIVCSHRPVVPSLIAALQQRTDIPLLDEFLQPTEFLAFHAAVNGRSARIVAVERHDPTGH
jgi:8-oxo-dGTP diphosphatase